MPDFSAWWGYVQKNKYQALGGGILLVLAALLAIFKPDFDPPFIGAPVDRMGWAGPEEAKTAWQAVKSDPGFVPFRLAGPLQDNSRKRVVLWDASRKVNNGADIPNINQEIGDCVSWGMRNALAYLLCVQIISGDALNYHDFDSAYIYGVSRVQIGGGRLRGDGSTGAWAASGVMKFGAIPYQFEGLEAYSGARASKWGRPPGPPEKYLAVGKLHLVKSAAKVTTPEEVRDAICNGYPVTIASNWGGQANLNKPLPVKDGRAVNPHQDSWGHQMCIIGYDGSASEPYWYVINSWGPGIYGGVSPDGAPAGGFWITRKDVAYIVGQDDSFAVSAYVGFPVTPIDWSKLDQLGFRPIQLRPDHWEETELWTSHYALAP